MLKKDKEFENARDAFDEIIKMSATMDMDDEEILTEKDIEEMGLPQPPPDMYDRIVRERQRRETHAHTGRKYKKTRLLLIAAVILVLMFGAMSVQAVRVYVFKIAHQVTENSIKFSGVNENSYSYDAKEEDAYKTAEDALGVPILKPTYLPDGYVFDNVRIYENDHIFMTYKNQDYVIKITQTIIEDDVYTDENVDTKEGHTYTINAQNTKITIGESEQMETGVKWLNAVWHDEKLIYKVDGSCSKSEFEKVIQYLE